MNSKIQNLSLSLRVQIHHYRASSATTVSETPRKSEKETQRERERAKDMESSEEEDDFPSIESITPQSKIDSVHQSLTEKVLFFFSFSPSLSLFDSLHLRSCFFL